MYIIIALMVWLWNEDFGKITGKEEEFQGHDLGGERRIYSWPL